MGAVGLCKGKKPEGAFLSKLSVPVRDHPFPLLTADTLHRNGALTEQDEPFYEPKSALLFLLGQDSMEGALFEEGCQCVVPQGSLAAANEQS